MPSKTVSKISFSFGLFDTNNNKTNDMPVIVQYFNQTSQDWLGLGDGMIKNGRFSLNISPSLTPKLPELSRQTISKSLTVFWQSIQAGNFPTFRLVPKNRLFANLSKQEVLATVYEYFLNKRSGELSVNFGDAWLMELNDVNANNRFGGFVLVASHSQLRRLSPDNQVPVINNQIKSLESQLANANKGLTDAKKEKQTIEAALNTRNLEFVSLQNDIKESNSRINTLEGQLANASKELTAAKNEKQTIEAALNARNPEFTSLQKDIKESNSRIKNLEGQLANASKELADTIKDKRNNEATINALNQEFANLDKSYKVSATKIIEIQKQLTAANTGLKQAMKEKEQLKKDNEALQSLLDKAATGGGTREGFVGVGDLYSGLQGDLNKFESQAINKNFKLSNVSVKLKGIVSNDRANNLGIQFLPVDKIKGLSREAFSELNIGFSQNAESSETSSSVPDISGLTETAVRRLLSYANLKLNPIYQNNPKVANGAAFKQSPDAGKSLNHYEYVTVIFSKNE